MTLHAAKGKEFQVVLIIGNPPDRQAGVWGLGFGGAACCTMVGGCD